jgi:hypothetical protein
MSTPAERKTLYIVTFRTRTGGRCYYATALRVPPRGGPIAPQLPDEIAAQLKAIEARVAWTHFGPPYDVSIAGPAGMECLAVTSASPELWGRLIFA